ncbi:MAG: alginate lyase family protein [Pirellulaceae bacterium]|nr:alginate lyase family protein [Pirellulaceae bacterium]
MNKPQLLRLLQTARHLRPIQIANRFQRRFRSATPSKSPPPPQRKRSGNWTLAAQRNPTLLAPNKIKVFESEIEVTSNSWDDPELEHLVRYNLHYFDDLNAVNAENRSNWQQALLTRWISENPPAEGTGWEPYPLSIRIVNWIKWSLAGNELSTAASKSLALQTRSLEKQIELHLMGNHVWANAKALIFAGLFFSGPEADRWLSHGRSLLEREMQEQILPDGGHFELSPMYHCILLEDLIDLANLSHVYGQKSVKGLEQTIQSMGRWLRVMCHPDGEISFFNDASFGIALKPSQIEDYACRVGFSAFPPCRGSVTHLADTGYVRIQFPNHAMLIDVAAAGASYQPGHSHADTLSFEWSLLGQRVLVNSGTSCYGVSAERLRQRGTAAHNTVIVDQTNSSHVWSGFRLASRAKPFGLTIDESNDHVSISCSHNGYRRLPTRVTHTRKWEIGPTEFSISDEVGPRFQQAQSRLHFHPDWSVFKVNSTVFAESQVIPEKLEITTKAEKRLLPGSYHPQFEQSLPNSVLECDLEPDVASKIRIGWS